MGPAVTHAEGGMTLCVWSEGRARPLTVSAEPLFEPFDERLREVGAATAV
jgi:hypothetical protein